MKIALYIENGREQISLTPENDTEKSLLAYMHDPSKSIVHIYKGGFYACQGGWSRHNTSPDSTMIVIDRLIAKATGGVDEEIRAFAGPDLT